MCASFSKCSAWRATLPVRMLASGDRQSEWPLWPLAAEASRTKKSNVANPQKLSDLQHSERPRRHGRLAGPVKGGGTHAGRPNAATDWVEVPTMRAGARPGRSQECPRQTQQGVWLPLADPSSTDSCQMAVTHARCRRAMMMQGTPVAWASAWVSQSRAGESPAKRLVGQTAAANTDLLVAPGLLGRWRRRAAVGRPLGWLCGNMTMRMRSDCFRWHTKGPLPWPSPPRLGSVSRTARGVDRPLTSPEATLPQTRQRPKGHRPAASVPKRRKNRPGRTLPGDLAPWDPGPPAGPTGLISREEGRRQPLDYWILGSWVISRWRLAGKRLVRAGCGSLHVVLAKALLRARVVRPAALWRPGVTSFCSGPRDSSAAGQQGSSSVDRTPARHFVRPRRRISVDRERQGAGEGLQQAGRHAATERAHTHPHVYVRNAVPTLQREAIFMDRGSRYRRRGISIRM